MKLILPVCHKDVGIMSKVLRVIDHLGGAKSFPALVVSSPGARDDAAELANQAAKLFKSTDLYVIPQEDPKGWPSACNTMFKSTVHELMRRGNLDPFYFFEADNTPLKRGWLDEIFAEYKRFGKPFMGVVSPTRKVNPKTMESIVEGRHMNGSGIYPPNLTQYTKLFSSIPPQTPWDIWLQYDFIRHTHDAETMMKNWRSKNYRRDAQGNIICDKSDEVTGENAPIRDSAVVLHGCKDESLARLLFPGIYEPEPKKGKKKTEG